MRPMKIFRETSSSCSRRARNCASNRGCVWVSGIVQRKAASGLDADGFRRVGVLFLYFVEDLSEHRIRWNVLRLRLEVKQNPVPQRRQIDTAHVFKAYVVTPFEQGPHFAGEHQ